jgi:hypothetical protein
MTDDTKNGSSNWRAQPFTRLRGTVKGRFDEPIGPCTIWVGENQSGKSGRLIAVRYAAAGVDGYSAGPHGSDIARLAPEGCEEFRCELEGPSGKASFKVLQEGGKWKEPDPKVAEFEGELKGYITEADRGRILPLVSMSELLELGPDRGRRALMQRFGEADKVPEPLAMSEEQVTLWNEVLEEQRKKLTKNEVLPDAPDVLVAMNKAFAKRKRDEGSKIKALETALEEKRKALTEQAAGSEQLPTLKATLEQAKAWEAAAHLRQRVQQIEADKQAYREKAAPIQAAIDERAQKESDVASEKLALEQEIEAARAGVQEAQDTVDDLEKRLLRGTWIKETTEVQLTQVDENGQAPCLLCGAPVQPQIILDKVVPVVTARVAEIEAARAAVGGRQQAVTAAEQKLGAWQQQRAQVGAREQQAIDALKQEHTRILAQEQEVQRALAQANAPANYTGAPAAQLAAQINQLEEAATAQQTLEEQTAELRKRKRTRDLAKELEGESKSLLDGLIRQIKDTAEAAINKFMPEGLRAVVDLDKNAWNVLDQGGAPRTKHTMCGFEGDSIIPALAMGYTDGAPLRILTIDDKELAGFSFPNALKFFDVLMAAVSQGLLTQVFVAGSRLEPILDALAARGWHINRTDDGVVEPIAATHQVTPPAPAVTPVAAVPQSSDGPYLEGGIPKL